MASYEAGWQCVYRVYSSQGRRVAMKVWRESDIEIELGEGDKHALFLQLGS